MEFGDVYGRGVRKIVALTGMGPPQEDQESINPDPWGLSET